MKFLRGRRKGFPYGVHHIKKACDMAPCEVHWNCEERIIYFFLGFLKICVREWRLRIKMSERNLEDFLIDMGYIKD